MKKTNTTSPKKVTFSDAKAGDRVWSFIEGWGTITKRFSQTTQYPLYVEFDKGVQRSYTLWGLVFFSDHNPTLFWDEVKFEIPEKPLPQLEVDTKVIVWGHDGNKFKRHFSHFKKGRIYTFDDGTTSFSKPHETSLSCWSNWELGE